MKLPPITLANHGLKRRGEDGEIIPIPKADFYVDCRGLPDPSNAVGPILRADCPRDEALGLWMEEVAGERVRAILYCVLDALEIVPRRRRGQEHEVFSILTMCAYGQHRSVAMKALLARDLRELGYHVEVK